jgi:adenosine deaminase
VPADTLPKIELHLHLDCSLNYDGVRRLRPSITVEEYQRDFVIPSDCQNLGAFLARVGNAVGLLQTREALRALVENVFEQLEQDRVIYAELRFAPLLHTANGLSAEQVVDTVDAAVDDMARRSRIDARIILCTLRHFTQEQSMATVSLVRRFRDRRVAALDLAGDEAGCPLRPHIAAYRAAHEWGLKTTAHAGEACGPSSVWETLRELQPDRIGHGIRSIEDSALIDHLASAGLHLEICPASNVRLVESIHEWADHPVDALQRRGVSMSISTDIRGFIDTTLTREYASLRRYFGWTDDILRTVNLAAARHAFADDATKQRLSAALAVPAGRGG